MCGITGYFSPSAGQDAKEMTVVISRMAATLIHRGPDDSGLWVDEKSGAALGHRRLSIIDLSREGAQPMTSRSGRYVIVYNGEVYNFQELKHELQSKGYIFRGHSDTEVILAAIEVWGLETALKRFNGMFAFGLWDKHERVLHLVRDRLGIKPLYYGWVKDTFVFGSELKPLKAFPGFQQTIDRDSLALMMRHNYIPAPYSIFEGIYKLLPGHWLTLSKNDFHEPLIKSYWSAKEVAEAGIAEPFDGNEMEAMEQLDTLLRQAVGSRMVADVPLGAFLSGGYDSTMVVAQMQTQSSQPVKTFSIGFHEKGYNEATNARIIADYLKTDHTELYVSPEETMAVIPDLPKLYDEPFSDSSQIPTYLVSKLAREHVKVSLSGDGGDELFGGYNRYFLGRSIWNGIGWMPRGLRKTVAKALMILSPQMWDFVFGKLEVLLPEKVKQRHPGDKLHKLAEILAVENPEQMYYLLVSHWKNPPAVVIGSREASTALTDHLYWADLPDFTQRMMFLDMITYLPNDILTKVDRASMGVSLEARVPILDHRVVEFAWRLPMSMKIRDGQGKWIWRQVLYRYVPKQLVERPKSGFGIPIDSWLRGPLRDWAETLLDKSRLHQEGFFNPEAIRQRWREHLSGRRNWAYYLWDVLMFQAWFENNKNQDPGFFQ